MSVQSEPVATPVAAITPEMNAIQRIIGVFTSPQRTFESIDARPTFLIALIVVIVVAMGFTYFAKDIILRETLAQQETQLLARGMDADQIERTAQITTTAMRFSPLIALVTTVLMMVVFGGLLLLLSNVLLGGTATYKKVLAVLTHAWLIMSLGAFFLLPLVLIRQTMLVNFSLATFLPVDQVKTFLYQFLLKIEVFSIWSLVAGTIGMSVVAKVKLSKMAVGMVIFYLLVALGGAILGSM